MTVVRCLIAHCIERANAVILLAHPLLDSPAHCSPFVWMMMIKALITPWEEAIITSNYLYIYIYIYIYIRQPLAAIRLWDSSTNIYDSLRHKATRARHKATTARHKA